MLHHLIHGGHLGMGEMTGLILHQLQSDGQNPLWPTSYVMDQ